jgi:predicted phosphodiesterase
MKKPNARQQLILSIIEKFPHASNMAVARIAYKETPAMFPDFSAANHAVRRIRNGDIGARVKPRSTPTTFKQGFGRIADGITTLSQKGEPKWAAFEIAGPCNALVLSDIHYPYHDRTALIAALEHGRATGVDVVLFNGDLADFHSISWWETDPRERNFPDEIKGCRELIAAVRESFPDARIVFKLGNHEERFERYMKVKAPELLGLNEFDIESLFGLKNYGVEIVKQKRPIRLGDLNVLHGHEYQFAISNPVNPARGLFLRCKAYAMCGHFHQSSYHTERTIEDRSIATWSTGCLCDLHPEYRPLNNWAHGFARVEVASDGKFNVDHRTIKNGKVI